MLLNFFRFFIKLQHSVTFCEAPLNRTAESFRNCCFGTNRFTTGSNSFWGCLNHIPTCHGLNLEMCYPDTWISKPFGYPLSMYPAIQLSMISNYPSIQIHKRLRYPTIHVSKHWSISKYPNPSIRILGYSNYFYLWTMDLRKEV